VSRATISFILTPYRFVAQWLVTTSLSYIGMLFELGLPSFFLARDSIYSLYEYMLLPVRPSLRLSVCLSVRLSLSVTPVYQSRTVKVMIMQFSLSL